MGGIGLRNNNHSQNYCRHSSSVRWYRIKIMPENQFLDINGNTNSDTSTSETQPATAANSTATAHSITTTTTTITTRRLQSTVHQGHVTPTFSRRQFKTCDETVTASNDLFNGHRWLALCKHAGHTSCTCTALS